MSYLVYLAGGMEKTQDGRSWRIEATSKLKRYNMQSWDPYKEESEIVDFSYVKNLINTKDREKNFEEFKEVMSKIVKYDLSVVRDQSDVLLVRFDESVLKGAGTKAEISVATLYNKPVHIWLDGLKMNRVPTWCLGCFDTISYSLDDTILNLVKYAQ